MTEQTNLLPKRRFKEFQNSGLWEQQSFSAIVTRVSMTGEENNLPRVEYEDVVSGFGKLNKNIFLKESQKKGIVFEPGDVLYGKLRPYLQNWLLADFKGIAVGDWWVLRPNEIKSSFIYSLIQSNKYQTVANLSAGTKMPRSDWNIVGGTDFIVPTASFEQTKIGDFFETLNHLITLQQRKLEKTKALKAAYLSEMFPAEGEIVPKRRFSEFTQNWEEKKMSEITDIYDGTHQTPQYTKSGIKFVSVENISTLESTKYISQTAYDKEYSNKQTEKGDVLMTRIGSIGTTKVIETNEPLAYYVTLALLKPKQIDSYFLACLISSPAVQKNIWKRTLHIAFPKKINLSEISQINLFIPKIDEQVKIGNFFKELDNIITLHQRKLEKLQNLKKAYLHEMFI